MRPFKEPSLEDTIPTVREKTSGPYYAQQSCVHILDYDYSIRIGI